MRALLTSLVLLIGASAWAQAAVEVDTLPPLMSIDSPAPLIDAGPAGPPATAADRVAYTAGVLVKLREAMRVVGGKLEEARDTKDVVKLNCVNEKLTQLKALLRVTEQADGLLKDAMAAKDQAASDHELSKVTIAGQKSDQLRTEAEECIGQLAFRTDDSLTVEVIAPPGPPDDPTRATRPDEIVIRPPRPPPASPTL